MTHCISVFGWLFRFFCRIFVLVLFGWFCWFGVLTTEKNKNFLFFQGAKHTHLGTPWLCQRKKCQIPNRLELPQQWEKHTRARASKNSAAKVPCCTQNPLLALGHTAPSMGSTKEQIHWFARTCCSEAQPLPVCAQWIKLHETSHSVLT